MMESGAIRSGGSRRHVAALALASVLAGCGSASSSTVPDAPGAASPTPASTTAGDAPRDDASSRDGAAGAATSSFACSPMWVMPPPSEQGNVVPMPVDDPALLAARREAAATLGTFRRVLGGRLPRSVIASLKVGLPTRGGGGELEHVWVSEIAIDGDGFRGVLDNDPVDLDLAAGDPVAIRADQVEDWMIVDVAAPQHVCGGFTSRVVLARQGR